jgi:hypothetical protein
LHIKRLTPWHRRPPFFSSEMVPWQYLRIRRPKAGGMHLINFKDFKTGKDLKCPAARLTGSVRQVLSRQSIFLEKNGGLRCLENQSVTYAKPNRKLLDHVLTAYPCMVCISSWIYLSLSMSSLLTASPFFLRFFLSLSSSFSRSMIAFRDNWR